MFEISKYRTCVRAFPDKPLVWVGNVQRGRVRADCPHRSAYGKHYILPAGGVIVCESCKKYKPRTEG